MIDWLNTQQQKPQINCLKTTGFMNESGAKVQKMLREFKQLPEQLLVVHDDSDIVLGQYKISFDRGAAGHKGVQHIIDQIGTKKFYRLRIGIRTETKTSARKKASEFVLQNIPKINLKTLEGVFRQAAMSIETKLRNPLE